MRATRSASPLLLAFSFLVSVLAVPACSPPRTEPDEARKLLGNIAVFDEVGGVTPRLTYLRDVEDSGDLEDEVVEPPYDFSHLPVSDEDRALLERLEMARDDERVFSVVVGNLDLGKEYLAEFEIDAVAKAAAWAERSAGAGASMEPDDGDIEKTPDFELKGWSNAIDNRRTYSRSEGFPATNRSLRRLGRIGGCTGAMIGRRLVFTAAHCFFRNGNTSFNFKRRYTARRDGPNVDSDGDGDPGNDGDEGAPYGSARIWTYWYPTAWFRNNCHVTYNDPASACIPFDWIVVVLRENPWPGARPGWMGYAGASEATVNSWFILNKGYPGCGASPSAPAVCNRQIAHGDTGNCGPFTFVHKHDEWPLKGQNGTVRTRCDTSAGHSGGPYYTYSAGENGPYLVGSTVWNTCNANSCAGGTTFSSEGPRITTHLANWIGVLRQLY